MPVLEFRDTDTNTNTKTIRKFYKINGKWLFYWKCNDCGYMTITKS